MKLHILILQVGEKQIEAHRSLPTGTADKRRGREADLGLETEAKTLLTFCYISSQNSLFLSFLVFCCLLIFFFNLDTWIFLLLLLFYLLLLKVDVQLRNVLVYMARAQGDDLMYTYTGYTVGRSSRSLTHPSPHRPHSEFVCAVRMLKIYSRQLSSTHTVFLPVVTKLYPGASKAFLSENSFPWLTSLHVPLPPAPRPPPLHSWFPHRTFSTSV